MRCPPGVGAGGDQIEADPRLVGRARAGRDEEASRAACQRLPGGQRIVARDLNLGAQLHQVMDQVEGEAVVIVDDQDHGLVSAAVAWRSEGVIPYLSVEHVSATADVWVALAAAVAAWQGTKTLYVWRQEKLGVRKIEVAEDALLHVYRAEHALRLIRSPWGYVDEATARQPEPDETDTQKYWRDIAFATYERMKGQQEHFDQLHLTSLRVKALFGPHSAEPLEELGHCLNAIRASASTMFHVPHNGFQDQTVIAQIQSDIWSGFRDLEEERLGLRIQKAVQEAELRLGVHLGNR